jgi:hypothetical protein
MANGDGSPTVRLPATLAAWSQVGVLVISLAGLFLYGGKMIQQLDSHEARLNSIDRRLEGMGRDVESIAIKVGANITQKVDP